MSNVVNIPILDVYMMTVRYKGMNIGIYFYIFNN